MFSTTCVNFCCCCCLAAKSYLTLLQPHGLWPARLLCPWDFPYKNTIVGCHFLLQGSSWPRDWTCGSILNLFWWKEQDGLPWWLSDKQFTCQFKRRVFDSWVGKIPWRRKWQPTSVFLPGKSYGQGSLAGYSPWGHKRVGHHLATKQQ